MKRTNGGSWSESAGVIAGDVAIDVARQLAEPVRSLRDRLGLVVDKLERHVATTTGPAPYPWRSLQALRQDLAATYLEATTLARRLDELDRALAEAPAGWFDLSHAVDLGVRIATHHVGSGVELLVDLADTPSVRGTPGTLALIVAQLMAECARSAGALANSTLSIRTSLERPFALVVIVDNGAGGDRVAELGDLARALIVPWGGLVEATTQVGQGCAFELRLKTESG